MFYLETSIKNFIIKKLLIPKATKMHIALQPNRSIRTK